MTAESVGLHSLRIRKQPYSVRLCKYIILCEAQTFNCGNQKTKTHFSLEGDFKYLLVIFLYEVCNMCLLWLCCCSYFYSVF